MQRGTCAWLRLIWGLAHNRPKETTWNAHNGLHLTTSSKDGLPYGYGRAVLLYLVIQAAQSGRVIRGSLDALVLSLGIEARVRSIRRHLRRLYACTYALLEPTSPGGTPVLRGFDPFETRAYCDRTRTFEFTLCSQFFQSICAGPTYSVAIVEALISDNQLAALDLYLWYRWRIHEGLTGSVQVIGPDSPFHCIQYSRVEKLWPGQVRKLHGIILKHWPECPFSLADNGKIIEFTPPRGQYVVVRREPPGMEPPKSGRASPDPSRLPSPARPGRSTGKRRKTPARKRAHRRRRRAEARKARAERAQAAANGPRPGKSRGHARPGRPTEARPPVERPSLPEPGRTPAARPGRKVYILTRSPAPRGAKLARLGPTLSNATVIRLPSDAATRKTLALLTRAASNPGGLAVDPGDETGGASGRPP